jgi:ATP-binding cassette subfamily B protein
VAAAIRFAARRVWSIGAGHALAMGCAALLAALLAPVSVVVLGAVVAELNRALARGEALGASVGGWIVLGGAAVAAAVACRTGQRYCQLRLADALDLQMQRAVLSHASQLELADLEDVATQNLLERVSHQPGQALLGVMRGGLGTCSAAVQLAGLTGVLLWIEPWWSLLLVAAALPFLAVRRWVSQLRHVRHVRKIEKRRWSRYYARLLTQPEGAASVKLLGLAPLLLERHRTTLRDLAADNRRVDRYVALVDVAAATGTVGVIVAALWFAAQRAAAGSLEVGAFAAFWAAAWQFRSAVGDLGIAWSEVIEASLHTASVRDFLERPLHSRGERPPSHEIGGAVALEDVSFRYTPGEPPVLRNISLEIRPGEVVALVGPNGAGKSTLAKLIARLYRPTVGLVRLDGLPADEIDLASYHRQLAFVFQKPTRFEATVAESIAFGNWAGLAHDPEAIREIARRTGVDDFVRRLPAGYDTPLGRLFGQFDLSGGQWQRLALAQALAGDPRIVILDEPAAGLDVDAQLALHRQFRDLLQGRTGVLISHCFATVRMADRIFVLVEGSVAEQGTHEELTARGGLYAAMCESHRAASTPQGRFAPGRAASTRAQVKEDILDGYLA